MIQSCRFEGASRLFGFHSTFISSFNYSIEFTKSSPCFKFRLTVLGDSVAIELLVLRPLPPLLDIPPPLAEEAAEDVLVLLEGLGSEPPFTSDLSP